MYSRGDILLMFYMNFKLTVVAYHFVGKPLFPGLHTLAFEKFKRQLDHIQKNYAVISWPHLLRFFKDGTKLPENPCLLTFDDGTKDHVARVAPELTARGLTGLFFILGRSPEDGLAFVHQVQYLTAQLGEDEFRLQFLNACDSATRQLFAEKEKECLAAYPTSKYDSLQFRTFKRVIGKFMFSEARPVITQLFETHIDDSTSFGKKLYLSDGDVRLLVAQGMHIGGHSVLHRWMTSLLPHEREDEIRKTKECLQKFGDGPYAFSYPYGDYDEVLFPVLKKHQFKAAFCGKEKIEHERKFAIGRLDTNSLPQ